MNLQTKFKPSIFKTVGGDSGNRLMKFYFTIMVWSQGWDNNLVQYGLWRFMPTQGIALSKSLHINITKTKGDM